MVYVLLGTGFEETEAIFPVDLLRRAGIPVQTVGIGDMLITGGHGISVKADITLDELDLTDMDMLVLPGGLGGVTSIRGSRQAMEAVAFAHENEKYLAAICAGPTVLADLGITEGRRAVCYPGCEAAMGGAVMEAGAAAVDGKLITGASAGCAAAFGLKVIEALKGKAAADAVQAQIVIR